MAQPPYRVDALQVEPGSGFTLLIDCEALTGAMRFRDGIVTSPLSLSSLANLSTIAGVATVGASGSGAKYTTIQDALDAVSVASSVTAPNVILVFPGVYTENITINKDRVTLIAMGTVSLAPATVAHTVTITPSVSATPHAVTLRGFTIGQPNDGLACVSIVGGVGSTVGSVAIELADCDLVPTGLGCYTVYADTMDTVILSECRSAGVPVSTSLRTTQCASLIVRGGVIPAVQVDFSTASSLPSQTVSTYVFQGCREVGDVLGTFTGGAGLLFSHCPTVGNVTLNGNRTLTGVGCQFGTLALNGTSSAALVYSTHGTASGAGFLQESVLVGTSAFVGVDHVDVTFPVSKPSASYTVSLDTGSSTTSWVTAKAATGFTIQFAGPVTLDVAWTVTA